MKKEKETLRGINWTFTESKKAYPINGERYGVTIWDAYARPSREKERIYNKCWDEVEALAKNYDLILDLAYTGVKSYNTCVFTFQAKLKGEKKAIYILITPTYNYYYKIEF